MRTRFAAFLLLALLPLAGCMGPRGGFTAVISTVPSPARGEYPLTVTFDASRSQGDIVEYLWSFGDNTTAAGQTASHTYEGRGTYAVFLTAVARSGDEAQTQVMVSVHSKRPIARFAVSPGASVKVRTALAFDAGSSYDPDGTIVEYVWDFGDGTWTTTAAPEAVHEYQEVGNYTVTLVVRDNEGDSSDPATRPVVVTRPGCCGN